MPTAQRTPIAASWRAQPLAAQGRERRGGQGGHRTGSEPWIEPEQESEPDAPERRVRDAAAERHQPAKYDHRTDEAT